MKDEDLPNPLDVNAMVENMMHLRDSAKTLVTLRQLHVKPTDTEHAQTIETLGYVIARQDELLRFMCEKYITLVEIHTKTHGLLDDAMKIIERKR